LIRGEKWRFFVRIKAVQLLTVPKIRPVVTLAAFGQALIGTHSIFKERLLHAHGIRGGFRVRGTEAEKPTFLVDRG